VNTILLTAALAFAAWIAQRALHRADEQRRVASRLRAYLIFWQKRALALGMWKVLHIGEEWYAEDQAIMKAGGNSSEVAQKLLDVEKKYQESLREQFIVEMSKNKPDFSKVVESQALLDKLQQRNPTIREEVVGQLIQTRRELMEGRTFVTDSDVAALDVPSVARAVELRLTLSGLLEQAIGIVQFVSMLEDKPILDSFKLQICDAILAAVRAGYAMKV
jgi:hypothetical protein